MTTEKRTPHDTNHPHNGSFCARCKEKGFDDAAKAEQKAKVAK